MSFKNQTSKITSTTYKPMLHVCTAQNIEEDKHDLTETFERTSLWYFCTFHGDDASENSPEMWMFSGVNQGINATVPS